MTSEPDDRAMTKEPPLAAVILAHADPPHLHRLVSALDPFPVFLHCDSRTPDPVFEAMTSGLPTRCHVLERLATGWARWENVAAEVAGLRQALETTAASHIAVLTGSDYPLQSTRRISAVLRGFPNRTFGSFRPLPHPAWGKSGGFARLRFRHWAYRKQRIVLPVPRSIPPDVVPASGPQVKVLCRRHAEAIVRVYDERPDLVRFWRRTWIADETFVPALLLSPKLAAIPEAQIVPHDLWYIGWGDVPRKSPPWLTEQHAQILRQASKEDPPRLFARKFSSELSSGVLDYIDERLRTADGS